MSPPDDIDLTRPQFIGAKVMRREDPRLLAGEGNYVADIKRHGMLHIAFRRSDHAHALITNVDVSAAQAMEGVVAVYTGADIRRLANPYQATSRMKNYQATFIPPLAVDKVRYVGEAVVAVVAITVVVDVEGVGVAIASSLCVGATAVEVHNIFPVVTPALLSVKTSKSPRRV